ncbi:MAG TPA: nucleoside deaminase [Elusimicrobiota bacterium]|jgi:cytosine deaminase|nr:nucleoside deaminase [Elusimicrobiota bacterium]
MNDRELVHEAYLEALKGYEEGGLPIGSVLADAAGRVLARGHNLRVQTGDPTAHAEVACLRAAGRRRDWPELTLVSSLSPCIMCTGTALLYRIPRVVVGENKNFLGAEDLFAARGVTLTVLQDPDCVELMARFTREKPDLWNEDIGL